MNSGKTKKTLHGRMTKKGYELVECNWTSDRVWECVPGCTEHEPTAFPDGSVEYTADHLIRAMWSLLKRLQLDKGSASIDFSMLEWAVRDELQLDSKGRPRGEA